MANPLYTRAASKAAVLATFTWGDAHIARYARWTSDVVLAGITYTAAPEMTIACGKLAGEPRDTPWYIRLFSTRVPFTTLCRPFAHAPIRVQIAEADPSDADTIRVRWAGMLTGTAKNEPSFPGTVNASIAGWRSLLQFPLGIEATAQCAWTFGDSNCCIDLSAIRQTVSIDSIIANIVTVSSGLTYPRAAYWRYGSITVDGLAMRIVDYDSAAGTFKVIPKLPPPEWAGASAVFTPGCDRLIDGANGCRAWVNEQRFGGIGIRMVDYDPRLESH